MDHNISADIAADRRADRISYWYVAIFVFFSWITLSVSSQLDAIQDATGEPAIRHWLLEFTGHVTVLPVILLVPVLLTRFSFTRESWPQSVAAFGLGFIAFVVGHILPMVMINHLLWPLLLDGHYEFGLLSPLSWLSQLQKDAYTFVLLITAFWFGRQYTRQQLEAEGRRTEAKESGQLALTSGGRTYLINAENVRYAKAAANYVEVQTDNKVLLARMTLRELEHLLASAGDSHIRIHRSHLVRKADITELQPNGDGAASIKLKNGETLKVGRTYLSVLNTVLRP